MGFIKQIIKKLFLAGISGAMILGFVYLKDNYLEEGNSDMEVLNQTSVVKQTPTELPKTEPIQQKMAIEVVQPVETSAPVQEEPVVEKVDNDINENVQQRVLAHADEPTKAADDTESLLEEQMKYRSTMNVAFDELQKEENNYSK